MAVALACGSSLTTQVVPIAFKLPSPEQSRYRIQSDAGKDLGEAMLTTRANGDVLQLGIHVQASNGSTNDALVSVDAGTLEPQSVERSDTLAGHRYDLHQVYAKGTLTVTLQDGATTHEHSQKLPESAYDDQESLFLWRSLDFTPGYTVHYISVVVNPQTGEISRPTAQAHVDFRETIRIPAGSFTAWKVEFSAAGFVNTAWYEDGPQRRLLEYSIPAQGVTYYLEPGG